MKRTLVQKLGLLGLVGFFSYAAAVIFAPLAFLEIRQYSCEKMSCATQKSLAAGHIMSFQIHPTRDMTGWRRPSAI